ncbi:MAG: hypothetical protein HY000_08005 [Planctomycetes bacterium]|nr:hypothetical protein [Planctomycetota bacterium]
METTYHDLTRFLLELGTDAVDHTERNFLAHLIGVYHYLKRWGCDEEVCRAGMFHSIYGTQKFQRFALPLARRGEIQRLIGERAERVAYVNCAMDRETFDRAALTHSAPYQIRDRITGLTLELSSADFEDLCRVHLADWLEQVPHSQKWEYRPEAYWNLARHLGGVALASCESTYASRGDNALSATDLSPPLRERPIQR